MKQLDKEKFQGIYPAEQLIEIYNYVNAELEGKWRKTHLIMMLAMSGVAVLTEVLISQILMKKNLSNPQIVQWYFLFLIIPCLVYLITDIITFAIYKFANVSGTTLNYVIAFGMALLSAEVMYFHSYFTSVFLGAFICIATTAVYGNKKLIAIVTFFITLMSVLIHELPVWGTPFVKDRTYFINLALVLILDLSMYLICRKIVEWEEMRRDGIVLKQIEIEGLRKISQRDHLTNLRNRLGLRQYIDDAYDKIVYAMIDIDKFKQANDLFGHAEGDAVLKNLGQQMLKMENANISAFRYGGDEFLLTFTNSSLEEITNICELIRQQFIELLPQNMRELGVDLSYGISSHSDSIEPSDAIKSADAAMYKAKRSKR